MSLVSGKKEKSNTTCVENKKPNRNKISLTLITKQKAPDEDEKDELDGTNNNDSNIILKVGAKDNNLKFTDKCTVSGNETQQPPEQQIIFDDENSSSDDSKGSKNCYIAKK